MNFNEAFGAFLSNESALSNSINLASNRTVKTGTGMPRRAPIKNKVVPHLTGVMGGEVGPKNLEQMDQFLDSQEHKRTLPKIRDNLFSPKLK